MPTWYFPDLDAKFRRRALFPGGSLVIQDNLQSLLELYVGVGRYSERYISVEKGAKGLRSLMVFHPSIWRPSIYERVRKITTVLIV